MNRYERKYVKKFKLREYAKTFTFYDGRIGYKNYWRLMYSKFNNSTYRNRKLRPYCVPDLGHWLDDLHVRGKYSSKRGRNYVKNLDKITGFSVQNPYSKTHTIHTICCCNNSIFEDGWYECWNCLGGADDY